MKRSRRIRNSQFRRLALEPLEGRLLLTSTGFEAYPTDPGFEAASVGVGNWQYAPSDAPWIFSGTAGISGNSSPITAGNPGAPQGSQVGFIQGTGSVSQTVTLQAGTYTLDFLAAQRGNYNHGGQSLQVSVDNTAVGAGIAPAGSNYALYATATFIVTAGTHTVTIAGLNPQGGDNTALIDDLSFQPVTANQIGDPDFSDVYIGPQNWEYTPSGSPWTFVGTAGLSSDGSAISAGNPSAPQGSQEGFVQETGSVSQAVSLSAGSYTLSFSAAQRGDYNHGGQTLEVLVDGTAVGGNITPAGTDYAAYSTVSFNVTAGTHTITIQGLDLAGGDNTALIDSVSIQLNTPAQFADPDFAAVSVGAGGWEYTPSGSPWTFTGTAGITGNESGIATGNPSGPQESQVAFIQGTGSIGQQLNLSAGTYTLELTAVQRENYNHGGQTLQVSVDGTPEGSITPVGPEYALYAVTFTVTAGVHTIAMVGTNPQGGDNTALIDNVSLQTVIPSQLADPNFDAADVGLGGWQYAPSGSPWTFGGTAGVSGNGGQVARLNYPAPEGDQIGFVQDAASIGQVVNLSAGTYTVEFDAAQSNGDNHGGQTLQVLVDGTAVGSITPTGVPYELYATPTFIVAAGTHTIVIAGLDPLGGDNTALLGNVSIQAITPNVTADPDFSAVSLGAGNWQYAPSGSPWTFAGTAGVSAGGSAITAGNPSPPQGTQVGFVQETGSISQAVSLSAGTYTISFSAAQRGNYNNGGLTLQVLVDGANVGSGITPASANYTGYTSISFTVSTGMHAITIQGLNPHGSDNTALIDQVMVNLV